MSKAIIDGWKRSGYRKCGRCNVFVHPRGIWSCTTEDCPERAAADQPAPTRRPRLLITLSRDLKRATFERDGERLNVVDVHPGYRNDGARQHPLWIEMMQGMGYAVAQELPPIRGTSPLPEAEARAAARCRRMNARDWERLRRYREASGADTGGAPW